jgi:hypothetical protein
MNKLIFSGLVALLSIALIEPGFAGRRSISADETYYPDHVAYDSAGTKTLVRKVQLALEEDGYYVGSDSGNFGIETALSSRSWVADHRENRRRLSSEPRLPLIDRSSAKLRRDHFEAAISMPSAGGLFCLVLLFTLPGQNKQSGRPRDGSSRGACPQKPATGIERALAPVP